MDGHGPARIHTSCAVASAPTLDRAFARWCPTVECDRPSRAVAAPRLLARTTAGRAGYGGADPLLGKVPSRPSTPLPMPSSFRTVRACRCCGTGSPPPSRAQGRAAAWSTTGWRPPRRPTSWRKRRTVRTGTMLQAGHITDPPAPFELGSRPCPLRRRLPPQPRGTARTLAQAGFCCSIRPCEAGTRLGSLLNDEPLA